MISWNVATSNIAPKTERGLQLSSRFKRDPDFIVNGKWSKDPCDEVEGIGVVIAEISSIEGSEDACSGVDARTGKELEGGGSTTS